MIDRIKRFIDLQNLTSSSFANEIGVQRSSVSHVLSGRNKPSLDFVTKIKDRFPEVNLEWLISGKGSMISIKENIKTEKEFDSSEINLENKQSFEFEKTSDLAEKEDEFKSSNIIEDQDPVKYDNKKGKKLKKIILLYQDNSFEEFIP